MRDLNYDFKQLCHQYQDGSIATQADRDRTLTLFVGQLYESGYQKLRAKGLKPKLITALVDRWKTEELSAGTINRLALGETCASYRKATGRREFGTTTNDNGLANG